MPSQAKPIPQGYRSVTPYLTLNDAARALDFYKRAFGAQEVVRMDGPDGKIGHAEIKIGDSMIMLGDEMPGSGARSPQSLGGTTAGIFLYVENVDNSSNRPLRRALRPKPSLPTCSGATATASSKIRLDTRGRSPHTKKMWLRRRCRNGCKGKWRRGNSRLNRPTDEPVGQAVRFGLPHHRISAGVKLISRSRIMSIVVP